jgi:hypothetical protein
MDYGIIFLIFLVIIILIAIIALIYANRNNTVNLLASLPNYRIQSQSTGTFIGLKSIPPPTLNPGQIMNKGEPFWVSVSAAGFDNTFPLGLWKIVHVSQLSPNVQTVKIVNTVYNLESTPATGFLAVGFIGSGTARLAPVFTEQQAPIFTFTQTATNFFTLQFSFQGRLLPILVQKSTNFLIVTTNTSIPPDTFHLLT